MEINQDMIITLIIPWAIKIIIALAIFVIGKWIAKAIGNFAKKIIT